jgi:TonB-linked SusC/RagA family outer membrane protein
MYNFYKENMVHLPPRSRIHQILRIMKLTTLILTAVILHVSAATMAQKVTLVEKNAQLVDVFQQIHKQTGYDFLFTGSDLKNAKPVTINVKNEELAYVLTKIFEAQSMDFTIENNTVVIKEKEPTNLDKLKNALTPNAPPKDVTGQVTTKAGESLAGASVINLRTKTGTLTDAKGNFTLRDVLPDDIIRITFIGYAPLEVKVGDKTLFNLQLEETNNKLDQVVIQAYGQTSQRLNTGNIGVVRAETIEKQPVMNPLLSLEGQVPGLDIVQQNGYASAPVKVEIRGRANLGSTFPSDPLYVIDGVPLTVNDISSSTQYPTSRGFIQNGLTGPAGGQSPLFSINSDDIESISVLKDAVATAIYGSRGAQGVILITTKKGQAGKTKFEASVQDGVSEVTGFYPELNTQQYLAVRREALKNDGITPTAANAPDLILWDPNSYTDWQKALFGKLASDTKAQLTLSGGDAQTTFRISAGYHRQDEITTISGADQKSSASFDLTHKSLNQLFSVELSAQYSYALSNMTNLPGRLTYAPNTPPIYNVQGNLNYAGWGPVSSQYPFAALLQPYTNTTNFINSRLTLGFQPFHGLNIKSNFGYNNVQANQQAIAPIISKDPSSNPLGSASFGYNNNKNWIIEPQITYDATISKGRLSVLVGLSTQTSFTEGIATNGSGYTNDGLIKTISNAPNVTATDIYGQYKYAAIFGRLNYNWEDKYIIDLTARRDGSSKFGPGNQYGNFAAVGAAWIFTEEEWAKKNLAFLSFGKLRSSYGTTGSDGNIGLYNYLSRYSSNGLQPYGGVSSLQPTQLADANYQWQVNKKFEVALEIGFLKDRINFTVDYYNDRTGNQLVSYPLPYTAGFNSLTANFPAVVQNAGWELTLQGKIMDGANFKWSANFNIGFNHNKLASYPNLAQSPYSAVYVVGQPLSITHLLHFTGVDPLTGQYTYQDKNNDGMINIGQTGLLNDQFVYNLTPPFFGGFGTNLNYKKLALSLFFNFKKQIAPNVIAQGSQAGRSLYNQPTSIIDQEWQKPGDITNVARYTTTGTNSDNNLHASDAGYTDASFIRLKNLQLSYDLPMLFAKKLGMRRCAVFFRGQNLFVITPYKGVDPETLNYDNLPPVKTFTGGLSFNF